MLNPIFIPRDWYWRLADGRVYASARRAFVPDDDTGYEAFLATGKTAAVAPNESGVATEPALVSALALYGITE